MRLPELTGTHTQLISDLLSNSSLFRNFSLKIAKLENNQIEGLVRKK